MIDSNDFITVGELEVVENVNNEDLILFEQDEEIKTFKGKILNDIKEKAEDVFLSLGDKEYLTTERKETIVEAINNVDLIAKNNKNNIGNLNTQIVNLKNSTTYMANFKRQETEATDTERIQRAIDSCNGKIEFEPNATYTVNKPIKVKKSNIELEFNNATLNWVGGGNLGEFNGTDRYYGCLTLEGEIAFSCNVTSFVNNKKSTVITLNPDDANLSKLNAGDWGYFSVRSGEWGDWSNDYSDFKPCTRIVTKILEKNNNILTLNYSSPFEFNSNAVATIQKINNLDNIKIKNLNYLDTTPYVETPTNGTETDASVRNTWVGGIHTYYCTNLIIENYKSKGQKFPALMLNKSALVTINNLRANDGGSLGAGCGYGVQANACYFINANNLEGTGIRHLIDFSGGAYHSVTNAKGDKKGNNFDCHGIGEHDIKFTNCVGNFAIGNGLREFPEATTNITIEKSDMVFEFNYCKKLKIFNSDVNFQNGCRVQELTLDNCNITINRRWMEISGVSRGLKENVCLAINNCKFKDNDTIINAEKEEGRLVFQNFGIVKVLGTTIENTREEKGTKQTSVLSFKNNSITKISNTEVIDYHIMYSCSGTVNSKVYINNSHFIYSSNIKESSYSPFDVGASDTSNLEVIADNNFFDFISKNRWCRNIVKDQKIKFTLRNNIFTGSVEEYINNAAIIIKGANNDFEGIADKSKVTNLLKAQ